MHMLNEMLAVLRVGLWGFVSDLGKFGQEGDQRRMLTRMEQGEMQHEIREISQKI